MQSSFEDLSLTDVMDLKSKCPAFKNSCPFAKLADKDLKEEIQKCPEFNDGCPFKDVKNYQEIHEKFSHIPDPQSPSKRLLEILNVIHDASVQLEHSLGDCPVFHQEAAGCPFKTVRSKNDSLVDPFESFANEKGILRDLVNVEISNVKEKCPAFQNGCPFAKIADDELKVAIEKCPEFRTGCPFKRIQNMAAMYDLLSKIPDPQAPAKNLEKIFQNIHAGGKKQKTAFGDCPVFHKEGEICCPFKSVRSNGKHLIDPTVTNINPQI